MTDLRNFKTAIAHLKSTLARHTEFSQEEPVFPISLTYVGDKGKISAQMKALREADPHFDLEAGVDPDDEDESELVEQFVDDLMAIATPQKNRFRSLDQARETVVRFSELYPEFKPKDFYIVDAYGEKFPVDIADAGQLEIPGVLEPYQMTINETGVEPTRVSSSLQKKAEASPEQQMDNSALGNLARIADLANMISELLPVTDTAPWILDKISTSKDDLADVFTCLKYHECD